MWMYLITAILPHLCTPLPQSGYFKNSVNFKTKYINLFEENQTYPVSLDKTLSKVSFFVYKMRKLNFAVSLMSSDSNILWFWDFK